MRPSSSASRNAAWSVPNAVTTPIPDTPHRFAHARVRYHCCDERSSARRTVDPRDRWRRRLALLSPRWSRASAAEHAGQDSFDELYERGQKANAAMKTLTARFTETTTSTLLTKPLVARGRLVGRASRARDPALQRSRGARGADRRQQDDDDVAEPEHQSDARHRRHAGTHSEILRQRHGRAIFAGSSTSTTAPPGDSRPNTYYVSMVPKRKQMREGLARLDCGSAAHRCCSTTMKMTFAERRHENHGVRGRRGERAARRRHVQHRSLS